MHASLNDLTTLVGFSDEQRDQLRRALGVERQALFDRSFPIGLREVVWLSRVVWPEFAKVVEADVALAISEHGMSAEAATAWGMESHSAMATLIRRVGRTIEAEMGAFPDLEALEALGVGPPPTPPEPPITSIEVEGNVIAFRRAP